jgi:hypothetical protein
MSEQKRGCGYRKIGGLYLVSDPGFQLKCDGLPLELEPCGCCGFVPPFSRNLQRIQPAYLFQAERKKHDRDPGAIEDAHQCICPNICPLCYPIQGIDYGLMFVGKQSYTPSSFLKEAMMMGVSKRIPDIPSWLKLGETWVLLAHNETPRVSLTELQKNELHAKEPTYMKAIFHGFKPERVEMPVWKGDLTTVEIHNLEEKGITPVLLDKSPENLKRHKDARNLELNLARFLAVKLAADSEDDEKE